MLSTRSDGEAGNVRIVSWNVRHQGLEMRLAEVVAKLVDSAADIIALQEVTIPLVDSVAGLLSTYGYEASVSSIIPRATASDGHKPFASMLVSKWPMTPASVDWRRDAPFPESFARATVMTPTGPADVFSVHIPNGAGNGWKKVATIRTLAAALAAPSELPQIVAGDFNEPKDLNSDGSIVTFAEVELDQRPRGHKLWTDHDGETGDLYEWEEAVQAVLGPKPAHRLKNAHLTVYGGMFAPKTHFESSRTPRWFDHILLSPEFTVTKTGVYSEWLESGVSDHAAVWVDVG